MLVFFRANPDAPVDGVFDAIVIMLLLWLVASKTDGNKDENPF